MHQHGSIKKLNTPVSSWHCCEMTISVINRFRGCLLGLACGDAVGTTVEFYPRGRFKPLEDMVGGGKFKVQKGDWTDDTSMALCLAESLLQKNGFDAHDQMERYLKWGNEGYLSCKSHAFGVGKTVARALGVFIRTGNPYAGSTDPTTAGNGSIMRLAPVVMYYYPNVDDVIQYAGESSITTHGAEECVLSCQLLASIIYNALAGKDKESVLFQNHLTNVPLPQSIQKIADGDYRNKSIEQIRGTGYVVDSLEAALWCFYTTENFKDAILRAANLGDDADTTAAICGQVAGAYYGENIIPLSWLNNLAMKELIYDFSVSLYNENSEKFK